MRNSSLTTNRRLSPSPASPTGTPSLPSTFWSEFHFKWYTVHSTYSAFETLWIVDDSFAMLGLIYDPHGHVCCLHCACLRAPEEAAKWFVGGLTSSPPRLCLVTQISDFMFIVHVTNGQLMPVIIFQCVPVHIFVWLHHH